MNMTPIPARATKFVGVGVLVASLLAVTTGCAAGETKDGGPEASVSSAPTSAAKKILASQFIRVIDGDTIEVQPTKKGQPTGEPNVKVHMLGVTAPEEAACGGAESIANLASLFRLNEQVTVTFEPTLTKDADEDGNTLAWVTTGAGAPQDIGMRMVQEGFASASYPEGQVAPKNFEQYTSLGKLAVDQKRGIWTNCPAVNS